MTDLMDKNRGGWNPPLSNGTEVPKAAGRIYPEPDRSEGFFETLCQACPHWWIFLVAGMVGFGVAAGIQSLWLP